LKAIRNSDIVLLTNYFTIELFKEGTAIDLKEEQLKELIRRYETANFIVERRMGAMLRDLLPESLTVDQLATMRFLRRSGVSTSSELSEIFCVGKSSITAIITRLSDKDLIRRLPGEKDRRVIHLALTEKGEALCDIMETRIQERLAKFIQHFREEEAIAFIETFEKLARELTKPQE
jgi:Transcriptional regulators